MPDTARLTGEIRCPVCGAPVLNSARFQWGMVPGLTYQVGDPVRWLREDDGQIVPAFTLRSVEQGRYQWNCGDPAFLNAILFDVDVFTQNHSFDCSTCHTQLAAIIVEVTNGLFAQARAIFEDDVKNILGASLGKADIVIVREDGTYWPREDWYDHTVNYVGG